MSTPAAHEPAVLRALIVDDEPHARENVRLRLGAVDDITIVDECENGRKAVAAIREQTPDLVFLDVQMPGLTGLDVLDRVGPAQMPFVIFITAYDEYALQAFEVNAVDYLVKPIDERRFDEAIWRARDQHDARARANLEARLNELLTTWQQRDASALKEPASGEETPPPPAVSPQETLPDRLIVKSRGRVQFIPIDDIDYITSAGDYVELHAADKTHLMRGTMKEVENQLGAQFQRIHRSTIVHLNRVAELRPSSHGEYAVFLHDGTRLKLSRTYREQLQDAVGTSL
jgi:two-component system LytT family response regulator